jgi:hypothetical protein
MPGIFLRYNICEEFLNSKKELKEHKDKHHRMTNEKMGAKT